MQGLPPQPTTPTADVTHLWELIQLDSVDPAHLDPAQRAFVKAAFDLEGAPVHLAGPELARRAAALMTMARGLPPVTPELKALGTRVLDEAVRSGNSAKDIQNRVEGDALKLYMDQVFGAELATGNPKVHQGTITGLTPSKIYVHLEDPALDIKVYVKDLQATAAGGAFFLDRDGAVLARENAPAGQELVIGRSIGLTARGQREGRWAFDIARPASAAASARRHGAPPRALRSRHLARAHRHQRAARQQRGHLVDRLDADP